MEFFKKHIEWLMLGLVVLALVLKYLLVDAADSLLLLMGASLGFFYLASGTLVLLDRSRIEKVMRILYFIGMWSMAICLIGVIGRISLWSINQELLILGLSSGVASLLFALLNRRGQEGEVRKAFEREIAPLVKRLVPMLIFAGGILLTSQISLYRTFGYFREDVQYVQLLKAKLDTIEDVTAEEKWESYHEEKVNALAKEKRDKVDAARDARRDKRNK